MSVTVPKLVNKTLKYLNADQTMIYLDLLEQARLIEGHLRNYSERKMKHLKAIQNMH